MSEPRPSFRVAVVGTLPTDIGESVPGPEHMRALDRLRDFLDRATASKNGTHHISLATFTHGPGMPWARSRRYSIILIPRLGGTVTAERELVDWCDALVVVGNPVRFFAG